MLYDLIIVGGGPAGVAAGVYAARKKIKSLFITDSFGGQSFVSAGIQNWIGTKELSGFEFAQMLENHLRSQDGIDIIGDERVTKVEKTSAGFLVHTQSGKNFETKTLFISTGSRRRRLGVPGEERLNGKGVAFCATCDAPIFKNKAVAVVGGGNAGLEAAIDLIPYASKIYLLERTGQLRGDPITREKALASPKVQVIMDATVQEIFGDAFVAGLHYVDAKTGEKKTLDVDGVFVEIGSIPNTDMVKEFVQLNAVGEIVIDARTQMSSTPGIWAGGDCTDVRYKQNNIAAGDAIKALLNIYDYLNQQK